MLSNYFSKNLCFHLSLKPLFGNFHQILQIFGMRLGCHIDRQFFIGIQKFHTDIQSFLLTKFPIDILTKFRSGDTDL